MQFKSEVSSKYRQLIEDAFAVIYDRHRADEYLNEEIELMPLKKQTSVCEIRNDGINRRRRENYCLDTENNPGKTAADLLGLSRK